VPTIQPYTVRPGAFLISTWGAGHGIEPGYENRSDLAFQQGSDYEHRDIVSGAVGGVVRTSTGRFYVSTSLACGHGIYTFAGEGPARLVAAGPQGRLLLSPDQRTLAVTPSWKGASTSNDVTLVDVATGAARRVTLPHWPDAWTADGSGFLYVQDGALHRTDRDGHDLGTVAAPPTCSWVSVGRARNGQLFGAVCGGLFEVGEDGTLGRRFDDPTRPSSGYALLVPSPDATAVLTVAGDDQDAAELLRRGEPPVAVFTCPQASSCGGLLALGW
jgi:hypothetical protein